MKYHPILFSGEMVRAILAGRKSQTRRVIKPQPFFRDSGCWYPSDNPGDFRNHTGLHYANEEHMRKGMPIDFSPYGQPGDGLFVRETFCEGDHGYIYRADYDETFKDDKEVVKLIKWKPSIYMPRIASRILLEIKNIWVERLQQISNDNARSEGVDPIAWIGNARLDDYRTPFQKLWNSINAERGFGWETNPFCWVIEFRKCD